MNKLNKDLCHCILDYLKINDKYKIGRLNKCFNFYWNNYIVRDAVKIVEGFTPLNV